MPVVWSTGVCFDSALRYDPMPGVLDRRQAGAYRAATRRHRGYAGAVADDIADMQERLQPTQVSPELAARVFETLMPPVQG